jgi:murein L,D-transpeptidase YcbB/YkuD
MIDVNDEDSVKALETRLNQVKATAVPIAVNGSYDRETMAAVRAYQIAHGLTVDGLAGPETLDALGMVRI